MGGCLSQCMIHLCTEEDKPKNEITKKDIGVVTDYIIQSTLETECAICLDTIKRDQWVSLLPCGHLFHTQCIFTWFYIKQVCPYCETEVKI